MNWHEYFKNIAEAVKLKSKDKNTQIGAVIVGKGNEIVSTGYNSFPRGIEDDYERRQERPEKYYWFEHAERNAIYNAARIGVSTDGCIMYLTCGLPCADCARGIINAGIKTVYVQPGAGATGSKWEEHAKRTILMFMEADVKMFTYDGSPAYDERIWDIPQERCVPCDNTGSIEPFRAMLEEYYKNGTPIPFYRPYIPLQWTELDPETGEPND